MNQKALEPIKQTEQKTTLALGIDVGSTTVKAVVLNDADTVLFSRYQRHFSKVKEAVLALLQEVCDAFPEDSFGNCCKAALCTGSPCSVSRR